MAQRTVVIVDCDRCRTPDLVNVIHLETTVSIKNEEGTTQKKVPLDLCPKCSQFLLQTLLNGLDETTVQSLLAGIKSSVSHKQEATDYPPSTVNKTVKVVTVKQSK